MKELWVEKYRPATVDGYVFRDNHQKEQVESWIKQKSIFAKVRLFRYRP
mgnify:CR=1 FL=1